MQYVPKSLSNKDKKIQLSNILKSRKNYKKGIYISRKKIPSFKSKTSRHIVNAKKIYNIDSVRPSEELSRKTGCSVKGLRQIVKKGEAAYFSSGSRPNQSAQSWGYARLASSITGNKASRVDYSILEKECKKTSLALKLATDFKKKKAL